MSTITIGADLAKCVFSVCEVDAMGHVLRRQDLHCEAFALWLAQVPAGSVVAMEACSGAHHWARLCLRHGLQPRLIAAQLAARGSHDQLSRGRVPTHVADPRRTQLAIANKHARQLWAMLAHGVHYDPTAALAHPMAKRSITHALTAM